MSSVMAAVEAQLMGDLDLGSRECIKTIARGTKGESEVVIPSLDYVDTVSDVHIPERPILTRKETNRRSYGFSGQLSDSRIPLSSPLFDPTSNSGMFGLGVSDETETQTEDDEDASEAHMEDESTPEEEEEDLSYIPPLPASPTWSITAQQRAAGWTPPDVWETTPSPRTPPVPFSERRLSESLRKSQSIAWTWTTTSPSMPQTGNSPRPGMSTFRSLKAPLKRIISRERSDGYASFFSFSASPGMTNSPLPGADQSSASRTPRVRNSRSMDLR